MKSQSLRVQLIIIIVALVITLLVGLTAITMSALTDTKTATGTISFVIYNVEGKVQVNCYTATETTALKSDGETELQFVDTTGTGASLSPFAISSDIELTAQAPYIVFEHIFTNTSANDIYSVSLVN